jgi:sugar phosphate isomerase/epimerase
MNKLTGNPKTKLKERSKRCIVAVLTAALIVTMSFTPALAGTTPQAGTQAQTSAAWVDDGVFNADDVSVQLFTILTTLIPHMGDYNAIKGDLQGLADIGYKNIEPFHGLGLTAAEWLQLETDTGLNISSWHQSISQEADQADRLAANQTAAQFFVDLGLNEVFVNYGGFTTRAAADTYLGYLREFRDAMKARGIRVGYHTHDHEYQQNVGVDGQLAVSPIILDEILSALDIPVGDADIPEGYKAALELDVYWAAVAGRDPVKLIEKYADRLTFLHLKDISLKDATVYNPTTGKSMEPTYLFEEVGSGVIDMPAVIKAGRLAGVHFFVVEQDANFQLDASSVPDPYASLATSIDYLSEFFNSDLDDTGLYPEKPVRAAPRISEDQLALGLYSIRGILDGGGVQGNYDSIKSIMTQVRDMGYKNVEFSSGFHGLTATQWKKMLSELEMKAISMQGGLVKGEPAIKKLVNELKTLGLDRYAVSNIMPANYYGPTDYTDLIDALNEPEGINDLRARLAKNKIALDYHTHSMDFAQKYSATGTATANNVLDQVIKGGAEITLDTNWAARSGQPVQDVIDQYADDIRLFHMKDIGFSWETARDPGRGDFVNEEVGAGNLDLGAVISAGNAAKVQYYIVEQDEDFLPGADGALKSVQLSYDNIKRYLTKKELPPPPPPEATPITGAVIAKITNQPFTGKALTPAVKVTLGGRALTKADVAISYANNTNIGAATVTVTGKGKYKGTKTAKFSIVPKAPILKSVKPAKRSVKLTVNKVSKIQKVTGYQFGYRVKGKTSWVTAKAFKVNYKGKTTFAKVIKKLKKGKRYQLRVRAYKKVGGVLYYSAWSKIKTSKKVA